MTAQREWDTAFFPDEPMPVDYDSKDRDQYGLFTWTGQGKVFWEKTTFDNQLNPRLNPDTLAQPETIDRQWDATDQVTCTLFMPTALLKKAAGKQPLDTIPVTMLLGRGNEEFGYGLRYYFQRAGTGALLCVSGREGADKGGRWNVGIRQKDIEAWFKRRGFKGKPEVQVLAGYSTGYGVVQTINNELVPLDKVRRLVFFDCIYRCDKPALPRSAPVAVPLAGDLPEFGGAPAGKVMLDEKREGFVRKPFNTRRAIARLTSQSSECLVAG